MFYVLLLLFIDKNVLFFRVLDINYGIIYYRKYICLWIKYVICIYIYIKYEIVKKIVVILFYFLKIERYGIFSFEKKIL